jgi:hypothetical protein
MNYIKGPREKMRHVTVHKTDREEAKWKNRLIQDVHAAVATWSMKVFLVPVSSFRD